MNNASFLPEDYVARKAERRTNLICLSLFAIVMAAVFGAFLVTNRQWSQVKAEQQRINAEYQSAASMIKELNDLEAQKAQMLDKAELAASLVERVPRSILLAEMINRMPSRLSLLEVELNSQQVRAPRRQPNASKSSGRLRGQPSRGKTREELAEEGESIKVEAPTYTVDIQIVGVAPTDLQVSSFLKELTDYSLFAEANLLKSAGVQIDEQSMREFAIALRLDPSADVREVEPRLWPRNRTSPIDDELRITPGDRTAGVPMNNQDGD